MKLIPHHTVLVFASTSDSRWNSAFSIQKETQIVDVSQAMELRFGPPPLDLQVTMSTIFRSPDYVDKSTCTHGNTTDSCEHCARVVQSYTGTMLITESVCCHGYMKGECSECGLTEEENTVSDEPEAQQEDTGASKGNN
jgi:hypothetical protein